MTGRRSHGSWSDGPVTLDAPAVASARGGALIVPLYVIGIVAAEACTAFVGLTLGIVLDVVLVAALLSHYSFVTARFEQAAGPHPAEEWVDALPALALVPLLRILSLTMGVEDVPQIYRYAVVGAPLLAATAWTARLLDASWLLPRLRRWSWQGQAPIALTGVPLSLVAYLIVGPDPLFEGTDWITVIVGSLILLVFTGLAEELLFRGVILEILSNVFGSAGLLLTTLLFGAVYLGSEPPAFAAFAAAYGFGFGWLTRRSGSLLGVVIAHGLLNIGMILVWPWVLG